jgi:lysophospholipase L1-like esterase
VWKKAVYAAAISVVMIALVPATLEFALYLRYPGIPAPGGPQDRSHTWGHPVRLNELGFREREFESPKPPGRFRIMVLGDSFTFGVGLAESERYTNRLEQELRASNPGRDIEVLNFGVPGSATVRQRDLLVELADRVDPDLIVVGFCLNDPQPRQQRYSVELEQYDHLFDKVAQLRRWGFWRSAIVLDWRLSTFLNRTGRVPAWQIALQRAYEPASEEWQAFERALEDIAEVSDERGLPRPVLAILNQGTSHVGPTDYGNPDGALEFHLRWYDQAEQAATAAGMHAIRFDAAFASDLATEPLTIHALDGHPSAHCNKVYATGLAELISPLLAR